VPQSAKIGKSQLPLYPFRNLFSGRFFASWSLEYFGKTGLGVSIEHDWTGLDLKNKGWICKTSICIVDWI